MCLAEVAPDFYLDEEESGLGAEPGMVRAFMCFADRVSPSMTQYDWDAVEGHTSVAYIITPVLTRETAVAHSRTLLQLVGVLFERCGAVAIKNESSGIAHGRERWLEYVELNCSDDPKVFGLALYKAWVRRPLRHAHMVYSCGMHLLGHPDIELESGDAAEAVAWIELLGLTMVALQPTRPLLDGEGIRNEGGERRVMQRTKCQRHPADNLFFNPYGYIRLGPLT
ncbi:MAG: hypothetical protein AAFX99_00360 [Myxococcota bacterium]